MTLDAPADKSIITLWLGNVEPDMTEQDIRAVIYPYGQIASFHLLRTARCAFVEYIDREAAEGAASQLYNALTVNGRSLSVNWAKPKVQNDSSSAAAAAATSNVMLPPPGMERAPVSAYVLPGMPAPVTSWPPSAHVGDSEAVEDSANKRQRTEASAPAAVQARPKFAPAPPRGPPPSSVGLLAGLSAYGDDDDEEEAAVPFETNKRPQQAKKVGIQYPSMNPTRMGSSV